eukprot:scaffold7527_cov54-Cyclotella_meneghiniana.AAC.3
MIDMIHSPNCALPLFAYHELLQKGLDSNQGLMSSGGGSEKILLDSPGEKERATPESSESSESTPVFTIITANIM